MVRTRSPIRRSFAAVIVAVFGCGDGTDRTSELQASPAWIVEATPLGEVGGIEGPDEEMFQAWVDGALVGDSLFVVYDASPFLRAFRLDGTFVAELGVPGEGPGEYGRILKVTGLEGDSLLVVDFGNMRLTRASLRDAGQGTTRINFEGGYWDTVHGFLSDGSWVVSWTPYGEDRDGYRTIGRIVGSFSSDGSFAGVLREGPNMLGGLWEYPFSPLAHVAVLGDSILWAHGETPSIHVLDIDGETRRTIDLPLRRPAFEEAKPRLAVTLESLSREDRAAALRSLDGDVVPDFASIMVDADNNIWVKTYDPATDSSWLAQWWLPRGGHWLVIDRDGDVIAEVDVPRGLRVLDIGSDFILGVYTDDYDVPMITTHRIIKD